MPAQRASPSAATVAAYRHAAADFEAGSSTSNYDGANDLFVNFNEALEQLPDLQRELGRRLRRHLQFFFMNPIQKYHIRKQFPFKLFLQILKVVFITIQLVLFAELRISHVDFLDDSATVMRHKFLKDWNNERDEVVYPPSSANYAVFSSDQIIEHFAFIVKSYYTIQNNSFASFGYDTTFAHRSKHDDGRATFNDTNFGETHVEFARIPPIRLCRERIADVSVQNDTYLFDISEVNECVSLNFTRDEVKRIMEEAHAIRAMLARRNISFTSEDALIVSKASVEFNLRTIHFSPLSTDQKPECYLIKVTIVFDNSRHTGQVFVRLNSLISYVNLCNGRVLQVGTLGLDTVAIGIIDFCVLLMCLFSLLLCSRALIKAHLLKTTTCDYFSTVFGRRLTLTDQLEFFNLWYVMILVNDVLIVLGTVCKVTIEFRDFDSDLFTLTGILLGLGALLVYIGLLRYLGFFNQYNILVLTLKRSLPSILRFMVCTIILYAGFLIAGWVIIGPYSIKFRTLSQSSEALFSLLNGDDMFATFYTISDTSTTIKVVGTIYIYLFVCLFIYIVLSLFIAIIMDSYEVVKERYNQGLVVECSTLYEFLASAEPPDEGSAEARELFAADRLLRLDDSWLLQNWSEIRANLRQTYLNARGSGGGGGAEIINGATLSHDGNSDDRGVGNGAPAATTSGGRAHSPGASAPRSRSVFRGGGGGGASLFDYESFENPAHDDDLTSSEQDAGRAGRENFGGVDNSEMGYSSGGSSGAERTHHHHHRGGGDESLMSALTNGASIEIAVERDERDLEDGGAVAERRSGDGGGGGSARYSVSPRNVSPRGGEGARLSPTSSSDAGIVRLGAFEPSSSGLS